MRRLSVVNTTDFLARMPQYSSTGDLLSVAARRRGMQVEVLPSGGGAGRLKGRPGAHYFGGPVFASRVVDDLDVALLEPTDGWLPSLPQEYVLRNVVLSALGEARCLSRPAFVKPPTDKSFPATVYADGSRLPEAAGLSPSTPVQISDVVTWAREFRLFVLDGECRTGSQYATYGRLDPAPLEGHPDEPTVRAFARRLLITHGDTLPSAVVLDVGLVRPESPAAGGPIDGEEGWAVVEANMPWFANCYAATPDRALDVLLRAAGPRTRLTAHDRAFCRGEGVRA